MKNCPYMGELIMSSYKHDVLLERSKSTYVCCVCGTSVTLKLQESLPGSGVGCYILLIPQHEDPR